MKPTRIPIDEVSQEELAALGDMLPADLPGGVDELEPEAEPSEADTDPDLEPLPADPPAIIDDLDSEVAELEAALEEAIPDELPDPTPLAVELNFELHMLYDDILVLQDAAPDSLSKEVDLVAADAFKDALRPREGVVQLVGPGHREPRQTALRPLIIQPGDRVHFGHHATQDVTINGVDYVVIKEDAVLAYWRAKPEPAVVGEIVPLPEAPNPIEQ